MYSFLDISNATALVVMLHRLSESTAKVKLSYLASNGETDGGKSQRINVSWSIPLTNSSEVKNIIVCNIYFILLKHDNITQGFFQ